MGEKRSFVKNPAGKITHVDITKSDGTVYRWETWYDGKTPKKLVGRVKDGYYTECNGTDIFGSPLTGKTTKISDRAKEDDDEDED